MSPFVQTLSLSVALLVALPTTSALATEPTPATSPVTCLPIPPVDYHGQTVYPGGKICLPTP